MAETPVDISKLAGILGNSKKLLDKVEVQMGPSGSGPKGVTEGTVPPMPSGMVDSSKMLTNLPQNQTPGMVSDPSRAIQHTLRNAKTTKMPKEIVEAMISNPIMTDPSKVSTEGMDDELIKMINPNYGNTGKRVVKEETTPTVEETVVDTNLNGMDIKSLIREVVEEVLVERKVDEQIQIRVGDTIFTGKITKSKTIQNNG
tara:strand:- start:27303 stop:27905 length:603 start_codon:yes stop_codon:yes gene_type:complete